MHIMYALSDLQGQPGRSNSHTRDRAHLDSLTVSLLHPVFAVSQALEAHVCVLCLDAQRYAKMTHNSCRELGSAVGLVAAELNLTTDPQQHDL